MAMIVLGSLGIGVAIYAFGDYCSKNNINLTDYLETPDHPQANIQEPKDYTIFIESRDKNRKLTDKEKKYSWSDPLNTWTVISDQIDEDGFVIIQRKTGSKKLVRWATVIYWIYPKSRDF